MPMDQSADVATTVPRVRWGRAATLQLAAGGVAGFLVPFYSYVLPYAGQSDESTSSNQTIWLGISLVSAVVVASVGAGTPLLVAWLSWFVVSRRASRRLRDEVLAVVVGAIAGALVPSAFPFVILALEGSPWWQYAATVVVLGGIPGLAFALWVVAAWHRASRVATSAS